ncbi:hypothetical protein EBS40_09730 [bacterium]|nr:hypothetical protein [bacterium]
MNTKDIAKLIREQLKKLGITSKQVSVTSDYNSISARIKDVSIQPKIIEDLVHQHQKLDRCEFTGEILLGCNTYTSVCYDWQIESAITLSEEYQEHLKQVKALCEKLGDGLILNWKDYKTGVCRNENYFSYQVFTPMREHNYANHNLASLAWFLYVSEKNGTLV